MLYHERRAYEFGADSLMEKLISPAGFPLVLFAIFWFSERNKSPERKASRAKMRFWAGLCGFMACADYAVAWHNEIGMAWQNHPELTFFSIFAVVGALFTIARPLPDSMKKL